MRFVYDPSGIGSTDNRLITRGERRLMHAVLEDALRTLLGARYGRTSATRARQELAWFTSADARDPFTFERVCEVLGIDSAWLRGRVLEAYWGARPADRDAARVAAGGR